MEKRNKKTKSVGNGEGSLYFSETLNCWVFQYYSAGKRHTMKQKKKETVKHFKERVTKTKASINDGTYTERSYETIISILEEYIEQKRIDGITKARSYKRDLETLEQIRKTCFNFCNIPIQKVNINHIEVAKKEIRKYANNTIDKIWGLLKKGFAIACSPSKKILIYNIIQDPNLRKPISDKKTKKVKPLTRSEAQKLNNILDNEERNHKYRNIVKIQLISAMRIGEVLARSREDYSETNNNFNVHNTLTEDENYNVILGEHTKTYNKKTQIDEGQRFLPLGNKLFFELAEIIKEEYNKKLTNIYGLLYWDYENNDFVKPKEINSWLSRLNNKYHICKESLTTHRLRHTAITYWEEIGIPLSVIQYLAGHVEGSSITKRTYIDISPEYVSDELKKVI